VWRVPGLLATASGALLFCSCLHLLLYRYFRKCQALFYKNSRKNVNYQIRRFLLHHGRSSSESTGGGGYGHAGSAGVSPINTREIKKPPFQKFRQKQKGSSYLCIITVDK
jgi:hypothetical protein